MKKIIIAIMLVFCAATVRAENANISTSQYYVDTATATRQDAAPANNANSVMTYDSVSPDGIGAKAIYDTTAAYGEQKSALVTAATANAAIQNGINSEFVCANPPKCNLWDLKGFYPTNLPAGYTELEYIESDGNQWIDTGYVPGAGSKMEMRVHNYNTNGADFGGTAGSWSTSPNTYFAPVVVASPDYVYYFNSYHRTPTKFYKNDILTASIEVSPDNTFATINVHNETQGQVAQYTQSGSIITDKSVYLFAGHSYTADTAAEKAAGAIYYAKIWNNGVLVRNFIPTKRNSDNVFGMYDTVTNTFFTNQGTGNFIAGPVASYIPQNQ